MPRSRRSAHWPHPWLVRSAEGASIVAPWRIGHHHSTGRTALPIRRQLPAPGQCSRPGPVPPIAGVAGGRRLREQQLAGGEIALIRQPAPGDAVLPEGPIALVDPGGAGLVPSGPIVVLGHLVEAEREVVPRPDPLGAVDRTGL